MYVRTLAGLGKDIKKNGHIRQEWSECKREGARQRRCDITFKVKFRRSFGDFRREAERAFGRWMTGARARMLIEKREETLKKWHQEIFDLNYPDNAPMCLLGEIIYRGPNGTWRVVDVSLQAYMLFSRAQIQSGARCF
jgi:hypothetical protein